MGEKNENNIGYRYIPYGEKYDNYTKKVDNKHVPVRTPMVGTKTRLQKKKGYTITSELDNLGRPIYTDSEGNSVSEGKAIGYNIQEAIDGNYHFESKSILKVVDLISEGPIEGFCSQNGETLSYFSKNKNIPMAEEEFLQSVYFDGTKILNPEIGTINYRLADINFRPGDGVQLPLPADFEFASQTIPIGTRLIPAPFTVPKVNFLQTSKINVSVKDILNIREEEEGALENMGMELKSDWRDVDTISQVRNIFKGLEKNLEVVSHTIQNYLVEEVTVNIKIHVLSRLRVGKRSSERVGAECSFLIYLGNENGPFPDNLPVLCEGSPTVDIQEENAEPLIWNETGGYFVRIARGLATSDYIFETKFHLPPNIRKENRIVKVFRLERDLGYGAEDPQIECSLESIVESIPFKLRYPYSAIIGATIDSTANSRIPRREYDLKLLKVQVPANYLPETKQYFGNWNGTFKKYKPIIDFERTKFVNRSLANVFNRAKLDGTKQIKVKTGVKKYGSGSIFFPSSNGLDVDADFTKRISIKDYNFKYPIESDDAPKKTLRICDFGFHNFTIEFFIKTSPSDIKTIYRTDGVSHTTSGLAGFYKTIISSSEGSIPCGGNNESDENRNDNELYKHPINRKPFNYAAGSKNQNSLPVAGNWLVEVGTEDGGDSGQIFFRYFTYGAYYRKDGLRVKVLDPNSDQPTVKQQVVLKSSASVADGNWHHVAITRQRDTFKVWVDGADSTSTGPGLINTYNGDVRGFVYRSGTEKDAGLIEVGNDRSIRTNGATALHSSFSGYLDIVKISRECKYITNFVDNINNPPNGWAKYFEHSLSTVCLLNGDDQPNDGTKIIDHRSPIFLLDADVNFIENFGSSFLQWTDNPAWIFYDLITNKRYGLGKYGISADFVNKWNIYELGKYCDELVKTGWSSRFKMRNFNVVKPDNSDDPAFPNQSAGEIFVKISGFKNQGEFQREFPRHSTVAIFDLNDGKKPVKRVIEYIKKDGNTSDTNGSNKTLHSWLPSDEETAGDAVVKLLRPLSVEECFLLDPGLKNLIVSEQWKQDKTAWGTHTNRQAGLNPKKIIYRRYGDYKANIKANTSENEEFFHVLTGDKRILDFFFEGEYSENEQGERVFTDEVSGLKINDTSISGKIATEFPLSREILEPRFTCNLYLTTAVDAFKVLNDLSSVFLGLTYVVGGKVFASFDKPRDPIMNFTNSNVKDGSFVYAGSPKTSRFTTALVRYVDKYENFKPKVEYVEDAAGIIKYGLIEKELIAFGCTSRGQARRLGKWFLFSTQLETDSIQFTAGKEASYLRPGDIIKVIDKNKTRRRYGGRIVNVSNSAKQITLDGEVNENVVGQIMTIAIPSSFETEETLDQRASKKRVSDQDLANLRRPQIKEFKVSSVDADNLVPSRKTILGLTSKDDSEAEEIGKIKPGAIWILQNDNANSKIQETLFRVMNIAEENSMEYKISCLEYNRSKFKASEDDSQSDASNVSTVAVGGSGKIEKSQSQKSQDTTKQGVEEKQNSDSEYNNYKIEEIIVSYQPFIAKDDNPEGEMVYEVLGINWSKPKKTPDKYNIYFAAADEMGETTGESRLVAFVDTKSTPNALSVSFIMPRARFITDWAFVRNNGNTGPLILSVEVKSEVSGKEVESTRITFDDWDG